MPVSRAHSTTRRFILVITARRGSYGRTTTSRTSRYGYSDGDSGLRRLGHLQHLLHMAIYLLSWVTSYREWPSHSLMAQHYLFTWWFMGEFGQGRGCIPFFVRVSLLVYLPATYSAAISHSLLVRRNVVFLRVLIPFNSTKCGMILPRAVPLVIIHKTTIPYLHMMPVRYPARVFAI